MRPDARHREVLTDQTRSIPGIMHFPFHPMCWKNSQAAIEVPPPSSIRLFGESFRFVLMDGNADHQGGKFRSRGRIAGQPAVAPDATS